MASFTKLPGGLHVAIQAMTDDPIHHAVLGKELLNAVAHEAKTHGATFDQARFGKVIRAAKQGKIEARFMLAAWENCIPKVIGVAVEVPTVLFKVVDGTLTAYKAKYREDTAFIPAALKELVRERPKGHAFPQNLGLCAYFEQQSVLLQAKNGGAGFVAEYSVHSTQMLKVLKEAGADLGLATHGSILELKGSTPLHRNRWLVNVETLALKDGNSAMPHLFMARWTSLDGKKQIAASFTDAISTFTGDPIIRVQIKSNGHTPQGRELEDIIASLLNAGQAEAANRAWGAPDLAEQLYARAPIIALHGTYKDALTGLMRSNGEELVVKKPLPISPFGHDIPTLRVHAFEEPEIAQALTKLEGMETRKLGPYTMLPVQHEIKETHLKAAGADPAEPLRAVPLTETARDLTVKLAA